MQRRRALRRTLIVLAVGVATALPTTPASATVTATIVFSGTGSLASGIDYPCVTASKPCPPTFTTSTRTDGKGVVIVDAKPQGQQVRYFFSSGVCDDAKTAVGKLFKSPATVGLCQVSAGGVLSGHCGLVHLTGNLSYRASNGSVYSVPFTASSVGTLMYVNGGSFATNIHGELAIVHGDGCSTKTSSTFTVMGHLVVKHLTL